MKIRLHLCKKRLQRELTDSISLDFLYSKDVVMECHEASLFYMNQIEHGLLPGIAPSS